MRTYMSWPCVWTEKPRINISYTKINQRQDEDNNFKFILNASKKSVLAVFSVYSITCAR